MDSGRRRLLLAAALGPLALRSGPVLASGAAADVLVIGAGMAGIGAALALQQAGLRVIVLEARQRLGGRICTDATLGVPLDLGAAWIHGHRGNPLTPLVRAAGISTLASDFDARALYRDGERLDPDSAAEWLELLEGDIESLDLARMELDREASVADGFDHILDGIEDEEELDSRRCLLSAEVEAEYGDDGAVLGLRALDQDEGFEGDDLLLRQGYGALVSGLGAGLDVRFGQVVNRIDWSAAGVQVHTGSGSFRAPQAVVTLPLGVLAANSVQFAPDLDTARRQAMAQLRMTALGKRLLRFDRAFWPADAERLLRLDAPAGRTVEIWNLQGLTGQPILALLSAGAHNRRIEAMTEAAAQADALAEIEATLGRVRPPSGFVRTRWSADPFALGSYSAVRPGGSLSACSALGRPLGQTLHFAGEATNAEYPGTVHGALLSGRRAAAEVIEALG